MLSEGIVGAVVATVNAIVEYRECHRGIWEPGWHIVVFSAPRGQINPAQ